MTLELNREQAEALDMALRTRVRAIEGLIYKWESDKMDETTESLIATYTRELATVYELAGLLGIKM